MKTNNVDTEALTLLLKSKRLLTRQQYKTLRGQILAGDPKGAMKGLRKILYRGDGKTVRIYLADESAERKKEGAEP